MADSVEIVNLDTFDGQDAQVIASGLTDCKTALAFLDRPAFIVSGEPPKIEALRPKVTRVIVNGPATVVFWDDGEKTVVKCRECESCRFAKSSSDTEAEEMNVFEAIAHNVLLNTRCSIRYDPEKAVMAAMLKRLYRNWQDVVRREFPEGDGDE